MKLKVIGVLVMAVLVTVLSGCTPSDEPDGTSSLTPSNPTNSDVVSSDDTSSEPQNEGDGSWFFTDDEGNSSVTASSHTPDKLPTTPVGTKAETGATMTESPLANTYKLLQQEKKLTIGYIGGSITLGTSAQSTISGGKVTGTRGDISKSWVNRISAWFKTEYPEATIETVNAGISGTGTNLGLYRLESTLMNTDGHDMPDLVFIEFTTNDGVSDILSYDELKIEIESLIRNIRRKNPYVELVVISTNINAVSEARAAYKEVAEYFEIPFIDVGVPLQKLKTDRGHSSESDGNYHYTIDNLHPSATGYYIYADIIKSDLADMLTGLKLKSKKLYNYGANMPTATASNLISSPTMLYADSFNKNAAVTVVNEKLTQQYFGTSTIAVGDVVLSPSYLKVGAGGKITATFKGSTMGFLFKMSTSDIGLRYRIDGGEWKTFKVDDNNYPYKRYDHVNIFMMEHSLSAGTHTVEIENTINSSFALGALLVNGK